LKYVKHRTGVGNRTDLTPIQIENRARRRMLMRRMRGLETPKGTRPREAAAHEPIFRPMPAPGIPSPWELTAQLLMIFPWMRRRRAARLQQEQESQSMKDKEAKSAPY
jgi:hypothetical protein